MQEFLDIQEFDRNPAATGLDANSLKK